MQVLLAIPPLEKTVLDKGLSLIEEERGFSPPLGLLYVAASVRKNSSHEIAVLDCQVDSMGYSEFETYFRQLSPDVLGMTTMTMTLPSVLEAARIAKKVNPSVTVVLGGPHVHLYPEETICHENVDFLVLGEGETSFVELLDALCAGASLENVVGVVYTDERGKAVNTGVRPPETDLDTLSFPARDLTSYKKYSSLLGKGGVVTTLFTSRGCPFKCSFCDRPNLGKRFRSRSPENVVQEIKDCVAMGINEFLVYDDTFTVNKDRVIRVCQLIIENELKIYFDIRSRVDTIDEEMIILLKKAGCQGIHYGVEAGTEKVLARLKKNITIDKVKETFAITRKHGVPILAYFMIGNPSETRDDIMSTFSLMRDLSPDYVHLTVLIPFPGTEVYQEALEKQMYPDDRWRQFALKPDESFEMPHWSETFSKEELNSLLVYGYKQFYVRPSYILGRLFRIRSLTELLKLMKAGLSLLRA